MIAAMVNWHTGVAFIQDDDKEHTASKHYVVLKGFIFVKSFVKMNAALVSIIAGAALIHYDFPSEVYKPSRVSMILDHRPGVLLAEVRSKNNMDKGSEIRKQRVIIWKTSNSKFVPLLCSCNSYAHTPSCLKASPVLYTTNSPVRDWGNRVTCPI